MRLKEKVSQQFRAGIKVKDHPEARQHEKPCVSRGYDIIKSRMKPVNSDKTNRNRDRVTE